MSFSVDFGPYNAVFAVPSSVVDDHMRLAGAVQLKALLYLLRHAGEETDEAVIGKAIGVSPADVRDALFYWQQAGLLKQPENEIPAPDPSKQEESPARTGRLISAKQPVLHAEKAAAPLPKKLTPHRVEKPDGLFLSNRIQSSSEIAALMQETEFILGRPLSPGLSSTLLYIHDDCGLPTDVIVMLVQYAKEQGKDNTHYIESTGRAWAQEGILSHEAAEQKLRYLDESGKAWRTVERALGIAHRRPSQKEQEMAGRWVNTWHFDDGMLREAYDRCINATGKMSFAYINRILERWQREGICTAEQARKESAKPASVGESTAPSYDIDAYEKMSQWELLHKEE